MPCISVFCFLGTRQKYFLIDIHRKNSQIYENNLFINLVSAKICVEILLSSAWNSLRKIYKWIKLIKIIFIFARITSVKVSTSLKIVSTSLEKVNRSLEKVNRSLEKVNRSLEKVNRSLKKVNGSLENTILFGGKVNNSSN